nr:hypothetical protein [uncultured Mediterraneibacter sp.]
MSISGVIDMGVNSNSNSLCGYLRIVNSGNFIDSAYIIIVAY